MKNNKSSIGLIAGRMEGGKMKGCQGYGKIIIDGVEQDINVGGLVGEAINSEIIDSVSNVEIQYSDAVMFSKLKTLITTELKGDSDLKEILELIDRMNSKKKTKDYLEQYTNFISIMANHMTVISPYVPFLTSLIPA